MIQAVQRNAIGYLRVRMPADEGTRAGERAAAGLQLRVP